MRKSFSYPAQKVRIPVVSFKLNEAVDSQFLP